MNKVCCSAFRRRVSLGLVCLMGALSTFAERKPNIIYIFTDQQSATMMSCTGNPWLKTPAVDYLAANGTRFERAYTTNPKCVPARVGMITGWFPGAFGVRRSDSFRDDGRTGYAQNNIGAQLKRAGYDLAYGGKTHLPEELEPETLGFEVISKDRQMQLAGDCAAYINRSHSKPYYLVASFINPHDICYYHRRDLKPNQGNLQLLKAVGDDPTTFVNRFCPPLPPNFKPQQDEPEAYNFKTVVKKTKEIETFTEEEWRIGRWLYCRLTERVDAEIQVVLDAIRQSGQEENTVVIFSSDHGENDATYRWHGKETLNEESIRIPFIVMDKGGTQGGRVDETHLVSNGLDLLPTVLDYAGVPGAKGDPRGLSVRPLVEGKEVPWRKDLGVECGVGRMVMDERLKYIEFDGAKNEVRLHDLKNDPYEKTHFTADPERAPDLAKMKARFDYWFPHEGSPVFNKNKKKSKSKKGEPLSREELKKKIKSGKVGDAKSVPVAPPAPTGKYEMRQWAAGKAKAAEGSFIRTFVSSKGTGQVELKAPDGTVFAIRMQAMTAEDKAYLESIQAETKQ